MTWLLVIVFTLFAVRALGTLLGTITILPAELLTRTWGIPPHNRHSPCWKLRHPSPSRSRPLLPRPRGRPGNGDEPYRGGEGGSVTTDMVAAAALNAARSRALRADVFCNRL